MLSYVQYEPLNSEKRVVFKLRGLGVPGFSVEPVFGFVNPLGSAIVRVSDATKSDANYRGMRRTDYFSQIAKTQR